MSRILFRGAAAVSLIFVAACTQKPVQVDLKGQAIYGRNSTQTAMFSGTSNQFMHTAQPSEPVVLSSDQYAGAPAVSVSELNAPEPAKPEPVKREVAQNMKPNDLTPSAGGDIQKINPWTGKERTDFISAAPKPAVAIKTTASKPVKLSNDQNFIWPVTSSKVISNFGPKGGGKANDGINIAASEGEPIWATADGEVVYSGNDLQGYGNMILIKHSGDKTTSYAHLSRATVDKYDHVKQGDIIGYVGATGNVKEPQLHFSVREGKDAVDPQKYLSRSVAGL